MIEQKSYRNFITRIVLFSFLFQQGFSTSLLADPEDDVVATTKTIRQKINLIQLKERGNEESRSLPQEIEFDPQDKKIRVAFEDNSLQELDTLLIPQMPWHMTTEELSLYISAHHWTLKEVESDEFRLTESIPLLGGGLFKKIKKAVTKPVKKIVNAFQSGKVQVKIIPPSKPVIPQPLSSVPKVQVPVKPPTKTELKTPVQTPVKPTVQPPVKPVVPVTVKPPVQVPIKPVVQPSAEEKKAQEDKIAAQKAAEEKKALELKAIQAKKEALNKDYTQTLSVTEKLFEKINQKTAFTQLKASMADISKYEVPVRGMFPFLAATEEFCNAAKKEILPAEKDRSFMQGFGRCILTVGCEWNDWMLSGLEKSPESAATLSAGWYAATNTLPVLLGATEVAFTGNKNAPLTTKFLADFSEEVKTVGHGLTTVINSLDLDAEEKAAYTTLLGISMAGVMKGVKAPTNGKVLKETLSEANTIVKSAIFHSGLDKKALSRLPKELGIARDADRGIGVRWHDKHAERYLRIMEGKADAKFISQQQNYVQIRSGGKVVLRDGTRVEDTIKGGVKPSETEPAHIPYKEWEKWKEWDKP